MRRDLGALLGPRRDLARVVGELKDEPDL
jgi:hypothetical protein